MLTELFPNQLSKGEKHSGPHYHDSQSTHFGAQMKLLIMPLQIWRGKVMTLHLETIAQMCPKSQKWRRGIYLHGRQSLQGWVLAHSLSV